MRFKTLYLTLFGTILAYGPAPVRAQSEANVSRTIEAGHLRGVEAHAGFQVSIRQGKQSSAVISADSRLLPYLRVEVRDGILHLGLNNLPHKLQVRTLARRAKVTVNSLDWVTTHSGAHVTGEGSFTAGKSTLEAHSGSRIDVVDLQADDVFVSTHSGAKIVVGGKAQSVEVSTHSGSKADLEELRAARVSAHAASGSGLTCQPTESLDAHASSGASIRYKNHTLNHSSVHSSSGGSVRSIQ